MEDVLSISLLGGLQITCNKQPVTGLVSRKAEALLAYLACTGQPLSREVVATLLWEDLPQSRALANLSVHLSSLRKQLAPFLLTTPRTISLNPDRTYTVDVLHFEQAVNQTLNEWERLGKLSRSTALQLNRGLNLYQGDFLAGFTLRDGLEFEDWVSRERERLHQLAVNAHLKLTDYYLSRKQYHQGISQASRLLSLDATLEEAHRKLIQLLVLDGQSEAALSQYETCRRILAEELGVEPDETTVALIKQTQSGRPVVHLSKESKPPTPRLHNLPPQVTAFVGREAELAQISHYLDDESCRLLTLIGPGGIGKTRLALRAAGQKVGEFLHGVWFVPLAELSDTRFLVSTIAEVIGLSFFGPTDSRTQLLDYLSKREQLLVLDNVEHLLGLAHHALVQLLMDILHHAPDVKILVTSRGRLNLQAEFLLQVTGLPYPAAGQVTTMTDTPALQLFEQSVLRIASSFHFSPENQRIVREICQAVDGVPLAIELAAGWIHLLSPAEILGELKQGLDILETTFQDVALRHRSMRVVFDQSWRLLSQHEAESLKKLIIFQGGFTREAVNHIAHVTLPMLQTLTNKSLLQRTSTGRYFLQEIIRQYTAEKLAEDADQQASLQVRHAQYFAAFLQQHTLHLTQGGYDFAQIYQDIETELSNIRSSWLWALQADQIAILDKFIFALGLFFEFQGRLQEGLDLIQPAVSYLETRQNNQKYRLTLGKLLAWQAMFRFRLIWDRDEEIKTLCERVLTLIPQTHNGNEKEDSHTPDRECLLARGMTFNLLGLIHSNEESDEIAIDLHHKALTIFTKLENLWGLATVYGTMALTMSKAGNVSQARHFIQESFTAWRKLGHEQGLARALVYGGDIFKTLGQPIEAKQYYLDALALLRSFDDKLFIARALNGLGEITYQADNPQISSLYFGEALEIAFEHKLVPFALSSLMGLTKLMIRQGHLETAATTLTFIHNFTTPDDLIQDQAKSLLDVLADKLSVDIFASAQVQAQPLDFEAMVKKVLSTLSSPPTP